MFKAPFKSECQVGMQSMSLRTINYSPWIPSDLNTMISTVLGRVVLDDLKHPHTILLGLQFYDAHQLSIRPQVHGELIALILSNVEGVPQVDG